MGCPNKIHLSTAKRKLYNMKGSIDFGILNKNEGKSDLVGYSDGDLADELDDRKKYF